MDSTNATNAPIVSNVSALISSSSTKIPKAYHALSYIYNYKLNDSTKADSVDKIILNRFPESPYSEFILTRNSPIKKEVVVEKNPMEDKFLVAEQYLFNDNFTIALDSLAYIAENDSGNDWYVFSL